MSKPIQSDRFVFYPNVAQSGWAALAGELCQKKGAQGGTDCGRNGRLFVLVFESYADCEFFYSRIKYFLKLSGSEARVYVLPGVERSSSASDAGSFDSMCERTGALNAVAEAPEQAENTVVLATPKSLLDAAPPPECARHFSVSNGYKTSIEELAKTLCEYGYYNEVLCQTPGQFAVRGGLVDIYPVAASAPVRIDFFGDEVESIRPFDPNTQLAEGRADSVRIDAVLEEVAHTVSGGVSDGGKAENSNAFNAFAYLPEACNWIFFEPYSLYAKNSREFSPSNVSGDGEFYKTLSRANDSFTGISVTELRPDFLECARAGNFPCEDMAIYSVPENISDEIGAERFKSETQKRAEYLARLASWRAEGIDVFVAAENPADAELARKTLADAKIGGEFKFVPSGFGEGFVVRAFPENLRPHWRGLSQGAKGAAFVSTHDFFGRRTKTDLEPRRRVFSRLTQVDTMLDFSEIGEGDYIVHLGHGVCRYCGVVKMDMLGKPQELIKLEFEDSQFLYLPLRKSYLLSRYIGIESQRPKLAKLDSKSWVKVKGAAEAATFDYAAELLEMQSKRELAPGFAFDVDTDWQRSFEDAFQYTETPDQLRAADEVKADMKAQKPMDRLLCADVGFGKTEIAMRAAFAAAVNGKQTAVLCPTTILCQQHFRNFRDRFAGYPVVIEMLSRFRTKGEIARIKGELAEGKIDIIIATHAILADDVVFRDLGLLVIDEEHRFGVKHKERIKRLRAGVDVLSMSATPIPRTLYFAMMGAKSMSIMETPPKNRYPVETFVRGYDDEVVREAVSREIARNGQVFYLHNRVKTIEQTARKLQNMFPNLRIAVGHGQMSEAALEKLMGEFVDGKYDILVCTTIIESGLDIPNCNTIIIEGADKFGLAQLYQLRGRVGRFTRRAYAWLLLHRHADLVESARKRLGAIRQYNKPGAGFRIATRDLQLRGCGNILGARQSGHIAGVGFDLYCSLLKRSIAILKGEKTNLGGRCEVNLDFVITGEGDRANLDLSNTQNYYQEIRMREIAGAESGIARAYIPDTYIPQTQLRIGLYRRMAMSETLGELAALRAETADRFGRIPQRVNNMFALERIRILGQNLKLAGVATSGAELKLLLKPAPATEYFRINGRFPVLTKRKGLDKLSEIENYLKNILPSILK